jgi:hypothetical protein
MAALQRLRVLVNGSNMEVQHTAIQEPLVKFSSVPLAVNVFGLTDDSYEQVCRRSAATGHQ